MKAGWKNLLFILLVPVVTMLALALAIAMVPFPSTKDGALSVPGVFHVHTDESHDGFGTLEDAAAAARRMGARFLVLTEHNIISPQRPEVVDGVLIVPGVELSSKPGHVIALGVPTLPRRGNDVLENIAALGGEAILAHPVNLRRPWSDPSLDGFAGFEALSLDSAFRTAKAEAPHRLLVALAALLGDRRKVGAILVERPDDALARYDEIAARRPLAMMCGVDAHGLPPYVSSFGSMKLHLLLDPATFGKDPASDAEAIRAAIREARTFCSVPAYGDAGSFTFSAGPGVVEAKVDREDATFVIFRDGEEVARGQGPGLSLPGGEGVWRAEVHLQPGFPYVKDALWIASSAIHVGTAQAPGSVGDRDAETAEGPTARGGIERDEAPDA